MTTIRLGCCDLCEQPYALQRCRMCGRETYAPYPRRAVGLTLHADDDEVAELRREVERLKRQVTSLTADQAAARLARENAARTAAPKTEQRVNQGGGRDELGLLS
jgi:hypothetical protein